MYSDGASTPADEEQPNDMDLDSDVDQSAYGSMLKNLVNFDEVNQTTMDDIADEEKMLKEDGENSVASSDEGDDLIEKLTAVFDQQTLENDEVDDSGESESDDDPDASLDPATSFNARLAKVRARTPLKHGKASKKEEDTDASGDERVGTGLSTPWKSASDIDVCSVSVSL